MERWAELVIPELLIALEADVARATHSRADDSTRGRYSIKHNLTYLNLGAFARRFQHYRRVETKWGTRGQLEMPRAFSVARVGKTGAKVCVGGPAAHE